MTFADTPTFVKQHCRFSDECSFSGSISSKRHTQDWHSPLGFGVVDTSDQCHYKLIYDLFLLFEDIKSLC